MHQLTTHHVHSHTGHPYNELVDALAAGAAMLRGFPETPYCDQVVEFIQSDAAIQWSWIGQQSDSYLHALVPDEFWFLKVPGKTIMTAQPQQLHQD